MRTLRSARSSPATRYRWAISRSRSWPTASAAWCRSGRRSIMSSAGSSPSSSAPRSSNTCWRSRSCELNLCTSQRLTAQQFGHLTDEARGLADEEMLERGQTIDDTEPQVAHEAQHVRLVREHPVEPVGRNPHRDVAEPTPALEPLDPGRGAGSEPNPGATDDPSARRGATLRPIIEPLPA